MKLFNAIYLLEHYGYLTKDEAIKGYTYAVLFKDDRQYNAGRVLISLYRYYDDKYNIVLTFGPLKEDTIILTEKEIPELGK